MCSCLVIVVCFFTSKAANKKNPAPIPWPDLSFLVVMMDGANFFGNSYVHLVPLGLQTDINHGKKGPLVDKEDVNMIQPNSPVFFLTPI